MGRFGRHAWLQSMQKEWQVQRSWGRKLGFFQKLDPRSWNKGEDGKG